MSSVVALSLALSGPLPGQAVTGFSVLQTPDELRDTYRQVLTESAPREKPDYDVTVPRLVLVYEELQSAEGFSHSERSQMRGRLKGRLEQVEDRLARRALALRKEAARARLRSRSSDGDPPHLSGGGELARANDLIALIQKTIAPESWDVNGGRGSMSYFSLLKVLVVRQTGEVHHQLGDGLGQLRR
ncbi:MAG: hypothetical protein KY476_03900 [Planctomycetes bacterium]|nr:hypothetical protein [Planctomycetota bacterium]